MVIVVGRSTRSLEINEVAYGRKVVLNCQAGCQSRLPALVEEFIRDNVAFVGIVGKECSRIEDIIDEAVVADGRDESRFILTSCHEGASVEEALAFARSLTGEYAGEVQLVDL